MFKHYSKTKSDISEFFELTKHKLVALWHTFRTPHQFKLNFLEKYFTCSLHIFFVHMSFFIPSRSKIFPHQQLWKLKSLNFLGNANGGMQMGEAAQPVSELFFFFTCFLSFITLTDDNFLVFHEIFINLSLNYFSHFSAVKRTNFVFRVEVFP